MFDFLRNGGFSSNVNAAQNSYTQHRTHEQALLHALNGQVQDIQHIIDAMCKVYVAEHAKEISSRDPDEKWFRTDQPIIDHANLLDLQHKIKVAQMELNGLQRKARL